MRFSFVLLVWRAPRRRGHESACRTLGALPVAVNVQCTIEVSQALSWRWWSGQPMERRPSALADVARAAGVSLSTASRAVSEPALVRDDTAERGREAANMLGY